jgi:hypothetical protein
VTPRRQQRHGRQEDEANVRQKAPIAPESLNAPSSSRNNLQKESHHLQKVR